MKRIKITIILNELPKGARYMPADVVSAFQKRLSTAMEQITNDFASNQKISAENREYLLLGF